MSHVAIDEIVRRIHDLPSLPAVVAELLASMEDDDIDLQQLARKISLDQALTAKTLRLANSSFYGMQSKVTNIQQAMSVLGFHSVRTLVTACGVIGGVPAVPGMQLDFNAFWRHSIATAVWARALARRLRQSPDTAFTAGLLHNVGKLVLATRFPDEYAEVQIWRREHGGSTAEAQLQVFGVDDTQAGSALAAYWKFPPAIQDAIGQHRRPAATGLAQSVYLANLLAVPAEAADDSDEAREHAWTVLAVDDDERDEITANCDLVFNEMCQILVG
jgi:HD-like signal output (HDOD) protein